MIGGESVRYAVENFMAPHPERGSSHHITADHIIEVRGDEAHMNAQFIVFRILGDARPADGWPEGALGAQGTVQPIESGYYDTDLRRIDGEWKIVHHRIWLDLPMALPVSETFKVPAAPDVAIPAQQSPDLQRFAVDGRVEDYRPVPRPALPSNPSRTL